MGKYVTIMDIANRLGVSHSTVSRALNDHPRISDQTKIKVKSLADELGYWSNEAISSLKKGKSKLIGVIVPDLSIVFFAQILEALQDTLKSAGYSVLFFNTKESFVSEREAVAKCLAHRVDAIAAAISVETQDFEHFEKILKQHVPLVFFDRVVNFLSVPKIVIDDYKASYEVNQFLIQSGCRRIAHITGTKNLNNSNNRLYGYLDAHSDNGISISEDLIHYYEFKPETIEEFLQSIIEKYDDLDGLSAFNDYVAFYAIEILERLGKKVPEDISVFGFSDEPIARYMKPKLSSVEQVAPKIGRLTAQKIIALLSGLEGISGEKIVVEPKLIIRDSVMRAT